MDFNNCQYDPQTGRFLSVDPLAAMNGQDMFSPYAAMGNTPESNVDPNGLSPEGSTLDLMQAVGSGGGGGMANWHRAANPNGYFGTGSSGSSGGPTGNEGMAGATMERFCN